MLTPFGKIRTPLGKILAVFLCPKAWDFSSEVPGVKMQGSCRVKAGFSGKCTTSNFMQDRQLYVRSAGLRSFRGKRSISMDEEYSRIRHGVVEGQIHAPVANPMAGQPGNAGLKRSDPVRLLIYSAAELRDDNLGIRHDLNRRENLPIRLRSLCRDCPNGR